jgi:hypothetical protein
MLTREGDSDAPVFGRQAFKVLAVAQGKLQRTEAGSKRRAKAPARESNQLRYVRRASRQAATNTTEATSPSHCRAGVVFARVTTLGCTCASLIFSPEVCASCLARSASLNTTGAQPNVRANIAAWPGVG